MPNLTTIDLEYIFICRELTDFIVDHSNTLEHVSMHNCSASINGLVENGIHWHQFFNPITHAKPHRLFHFEISNRKNTFALNEMWDNVEDPVETEKAMQETLEMLRNDPSRRLFAHTSLDDKYGMMFIDEVENLASFQRGDDQASYDRLMCVVEENAAKHRGTKT